MPTPPKKTPRQARVYPTLETWCSSDENKAFVKELLQDPRFLALLHYSKDLHRVQVDDLVGPKAQLNECVIRKAAIHAGACAFEDALRSILRTGKMIPITDDWSDTIPLNR